MVVGPRPNTDLSDPTQIKGFASDQIGPDGFKQVWVQVALGRFGPWPEKLRPRSNPGPI